MTNSNKLKKEINIKSKNNKMQIRDFFASVKLAIIVLSLIATTSIIGTLIPQNAHDSFYLNNYGEILFKIFSIFNFFDMYHSWWFFLLLFLLVINITACSIGRLNKTWKIIFPKQISFSIKRFTKNTNKQKFTRKCDFEKLLPEYKTILSKHFKNVIIKETENSVTIYGEKGRWTRLGAYIVHLSILLLLIGALIGGIFGFKGRINLNEGESASSVTLSQQKVKKEFGFTIKCNTFDVKFYDTGAPEEFKSNLSIIENDKEILKTNIIVNDPLRYKGINFFQSSYGTASSDTLSLKIESNKSKIVYHQTVKIGQSFSIPENGGEFTLIRYLPHFDFKGHKLGESFIGTVKKDGEKEFMVILPTTFPTFDRMRHGNFAFLADDFKKTYYTGLQVTYDPGVIYVYLGFIFMIAGCFITFFMSHQSIMIEIAKEQNGINNIIISGTANRNNQNMKIKIEKMYDQLAKIMVN